MIELVFHKFEFHFHEYLFSSKIRISFLFLSTKNYYQSEIQLACQTLSDIMVYEMSGLETLCIDKEAFPYTIFESNTQMSYNGKLLDFELCPGSFCSTFIFEFLW